MVEPALGAIGVSRAYDLSPERDPFRRLKQGIVGALLAVSTLAIAYDAFVYGGAASDPDPVHAEQKQATQQRGRAQTRAGVTYDHDANLQSLLAQTASQPDSRCAGFHRRFLRKAIQRYADGHVNAVREAARDPALADLPALYKTPQDERALREALDILRSGYLLATDFDEWTPAEQAVFPLPSGVVPACSRSMWESEKDAPR